MTIRTRHWPHPFQRSVTYVWAVLMRCGAWEYFWIISRGSSTLRSFASYRYMFIYTYTLYLFINSKLYENHEICFRYIKHWSLHKASSTFFSWFRKAPAGFWSKTGGACYTYMGSRWLGGQQLVTWNENESTASASIGTWNICLKAIKGLLKFKKELEMMGGCMVWVRQCSSAKGLWYGFQLPQSAAFN